MAKLLAIKDIVKDLREMGYDVEVYQRTDPQGRKRGMLIRRINGVSYKGSTGNVYARELLQVKLPELVTKALAKRQKEGLSKKAPAKRRQEPIPEDVEKYIKKVQRIFRKNGLKQGQITMKKYRYAEKEYGKERALQMVKQAERYARKLAYEENINAFILRLEHFEIGLQTAYPNTSIQSSIDYLKQYDKDKFTEEKLQALIAGYYDMVNVLNATNDPKYADNFNSYVKLVMSQA